MRLCREATSLTQADDEVDPMRVSLIRAAVEISGRPSVCLIVVYSFYTFNHQAASTDVLIIDCSLLLDMHLFQML